MILTTTQLRQHLATSLPDDALRPLLEAAERDIDKAAGTETRTEWDNGGHTALVLSRPVGTVTSITELADGTAPVVLSTDDYRIEGYILRRLTTGTNPGYTWAGPVEVVHTPDADTAERIRAQVALVNLEIAYAKGIISERIGDYSVGYANSAGGQTYEEARQQILSGLDALKVA